MTQSQGLWEGVSADSALRPGVEDGAAQADGGVGAGVAGTPVPSGTWRSRPTPMSLLGDEDRRGLAGGAKHLALGTTGQIHTHWHAGPRATSTCAGPRRGSRDPGLTGRWESPQNVWPLISASPLSRGAVVVAGAGLGGWLCGRCPREHGRAMQGDRGPRC